MSKFTAKYEVQIPANSSFQTARKIIGFRGCNMKKIVECLKCEAPADIVKLRLRGQGSGYKEGHLKRESNEPLHLCVSSEYYDKFSTACVEAEKLIARIYKEYEMFLRKNHQ